MWSIFVEKESYKGISEYIHLKLNGTHGVNTWLYSNICHNLLQIQLIECVPLQVCQTNIRREKVRGVVRQSPPDRLPQDRRGKSNTCNRYILPSWSVFSFSFSRLFHEIFHDGTTSYAQHYELNRSRPVFNISRYFVTLNMMGANSATLHKWEYNCHQNRKLANCFAWKRFV